MKWILVVVISVMLFVPAQLTQAMPGEDVTDKFTKALLAHKYELAQSYLNHDAKMPEIREDSPIRGVTGLPTPINGERILIAYFWDDEGLKGERIAFIWKLTIKRDQITHIETISDAANPFMNENKTVNDYRTRYNLHVMVPGEFPFDVNTVQGKIIDENIKLMYEDAADDKYVLIQAEPIGTKSIMMNLPNPIKVKSGYESRFLKDGLHYTVTLGHKRWLSHISKKDLTKVVESLK